MSSNTEQLETEELALAVRDALAGELREQSRWREMKADEWPEDSRNRRSADALDEAAGIIAGFGPDEIHEIAGGFIELALLTGHEDEPHVVIGGGSRVAGRFYFDNGEHKVAWMREVNELVREMFLETLDGWAEGLDEEAERKELKLFESAVTPDIRNFAAQRLRQLDDDDWT